MHISPQQAYFILAEHKYQKAFASVAVLRSFAHRYFSVDENARARCCIFLGLKTVKKIYYTLQINGYSPVKHLEKITVGFLIAK